VDETEWHGIEFDLDGQSVQIVTNLPQEEFQIIDVNVERLLENLEYFNIKLNNGEPTRIEIHNYDLEYKNAKNPFCEGVHVDYGWDTFNIICSTQGTNPYQFYISPWGIRSCLSTASRLGVRADDEARLYGKISYMLLVGIMAAEKQLTPSIFDSIRETLRSAYHDGNINYDFIGLDIGDTPFDHLAGDSQMIFGDSLENGWRLSAESGEILTNGRTDVYSGEHAIEVILKENDKNAYESHIHFAHERIDTSQYDWIEFQLYTPTDGIGIFMSAAAADGEYLTDEPGAFPISPYTRGGYFFGDRWQTVRMPLTEIGVEGDDLGKIWLRIFSGSPVSVFIDEIKFLAPQQSF